MHIFKSRSKMTTFTWNSCVALVSLNCSSLIYIWVTWNVEVIYQGLSIKKVTLFKHLIQIIPILHICGPKVQWTILFIKQIYNWFFNFLLYCCSRLFAYCIKYPCLGTKNVHKPIGKVVNVQNGRLKIYIKDLEMEWPLIKQIIWGTENEVFNITLHSVDG